MKKARFILLLFTMAFAVVIPLLFSANAVAFAENEDSVEEDLETEVNDGVDSLIGDDIENYYNDVSGDGYSAFGNSIKEIIDKIIDGENIGAATIFSFIWQSVKDSLLSVIGGFASIIGLAILYGISKNINGGFMKNSTSKVVYFAIYGAIVCSYTVMLSSVIISAQRAINNISELVDISFPVLLTVMTALGGASAVGAYQQGALIFGNVIITVINAVIFPMFYATVVFSIIGHLTDNVKLGKLTSAISSAAKWILGVTFGAFSAIITATGLVGSGIDNVGVKSARFALSSYVPILGGYLSDGFDIVMASAALIKNAFGLCVVIMLFIAILAPVVKLVLFMLATKLAAGITEPVSGTKISGMLYSVSKSLGILISAVLGTGFIVFVMTLLVIVSCNAGVL